MFSIQLIFNACENYWGTQLKSLIENRPQESMYKSAGLSRSDVPWQESLLYTHALSVPVTLSGQRT